MAKFVSVFLSLRQQNLFAALIWFLSFLAFAGSLALIGSERLLATARADAGQALSDIQRTSANAVRALDLLARQAAGLSCGDAMQAEMRFVSILPDGLNEFMFIRDGMARCSNNFGEFAKPSPLTTPDASRGGQLPFDVWFAKDLSFAGYPRMSGIVVRRGDFATIVRPSELQRAPPDWLALETVLLGDDGRIWPFNGKMGVFAEAAGAAAAGGQALVSHQTVCDAHAFQCIGLRADLRAGLLGDRLLLSVGLGLAAALASVTAFLARRALVRYFSFDARFARHLGPDSLICAYQPILSLATGRIVGCEVLARWRDIDDRIVSPDRFIPVVEKRAMTLAFTRLVVEKAYSELCLHMRADDPLQVNFNVFPADLGKPELAEIFACFTSASNQFVPVAEIVETEELDVATAQSHIDRLRREGVRVYIDDFGTGYSNMHNVAALSVDGVKLDRCFAMAPDGSVMARMLEPAIEMLRSTAGAIVVEGVETNERLEGLRTGPMRVDYAQGYHIARPLPVEAFAILPMAMPTRTPVRVAA